MLPYKRARNQPNAMEMHVNQGLINKYYAQIYGKNEVYQYIKFKQHLLSMILIIQENKHEIENN